MHKNTVKARDLFFIFAFAVFSAFIIMHAPSVNAQSPGEISVSDSDALIAALTDSSCSTIILKEQAIYTIEQPVSAGHSLKIVGNSATIDFAAEASLNVPGGVEVTLSKVTFSNRSSHSLAVSGSVVFGENVFFAGKEGIGLTGGQLTSAGAAVTAVSGLETLVHAKPSAGSVTLRDIRLTQTSGESELLVVDNCSGSVYFGGNVELFAANGTALYSPSGSYNPQISIENGASLSIAAPNAVLNQQLDVPGAAADIRSCDLVVGTGVTLGVTGSYSGIAARNITLGDNSNVSAVCQRQSDSGSPKCSALYASGQIVCKAGVKLSFGSSGGNFGSGMYAEDSIQAGNLFSMVFRGSSSYCSAIYSEASVSLGSECSLISVGSVYGVRSSGLTIGEKSTIDFDETINDGIRSSGQIAIGSDATIDIHGGRCAVSSSAGIAFSSGSIINLSSDGRGPAILIDGTASDSLVLNGCKLKVEHNSAANSEKRAAVFTSGSIMIDSGADVSFFNSKDFGLISSGGSINISGKNTVLRCSGGVGILVSKGSLSVADNATLLVQGLVDSAVRIERGSFSATNGTTVDVQGARFGVEALSGDFYIDGASVFDIRSTSDRAVFVKNGRMTVLNVDRISAWKRAEDSKNSSSWWKNEPKCAHSWEITADGNKENWLIADHTALNPNIAQVHEQGIAQPCGFAWYDGEWLPADYSRLAQHISRPYGRANSFNIPAGKSFSWMLFGESYDNQLKYRLLESSGDGTFDLKEDGTFTYSSLSYSRGFQTFDFVVENGDGVTSQPVTVSVFVTASKPPVANSATFPVDKEEKYIGQVSVMDYDGTIAAINIIEQPRHGHLIMNSDGKFSYEPEEDFSGLDYFRYTAEDNMGDESSEAYISLAVDMAEIPIVCNGTIVTESSVEASIRLSALIGRESVEPAPQYIILTQPVYGELVISENEPDLVTYIPYKDFSGTDLFTFAAVLEDGTQTNEAYVTIATVPSQRPNAHSEVYYCTKNSSCSGRLSGYDIDGTINIFTITDYPENGKLELDTVTGDFTYYAESGYTGTVRFSFTVTDSDGLISDPVSVEIKVSSLIENLRSSGRLGTAIVLFCIGIAALAALAAYFFVSAAKRRRQFEEDIAKSRLFEYGGSEANYDNEYMKK